MRDITLNRIPVLTWRWLKMNETAVSIPSETGSANIKVLNENANNELSKDIIEAMKALPTGMGANMTELCDSESEDIIINTLAGEKSNSHINICRDKESLAKVRVYIYAAEGSDVNVWMDYSSNEENAGAFGGTDIRFCRERCKGKIVSGRTSVRQ